jgi:DNA-binding MarR family transcriptional regulator
MVRGCCDRNYLVNVCGRKKYSRPPDTIIGVPHTDVRWLSEDQQRAWRSLITTTTGLLATLDSELQAAHGLSLGDYEVLANLSEAPNRSLRMTDLAGRLHLSPSGITRRIDGLVKAGWVERTPCPTDRRSSYAVLTDAGFAILQEAAPTHVEGVRAHFVDRLSAEELERLAAALAAAEIDPGASSPECDEARPSALG